MAAKFPLSLEKEGLLRAMQDFPEDYDLIARLGKVTAAILATLPLKPPLHQSALRTIRKFLK
jgi:hypothetical protein